MGLFFPHGKTSSGLLPGFVETDPRLSEWECGVRREKPRYPLLIVCCVKPRVKQPGGNLGVFRRGCPISKSSQWSWRKSRNESDGGTDIPFTPRHKLLHCPLLLYTVFICMHVEFFRIFHDSKAEQTLDKYKTTSCCAKHCVVCCFQEVRLTKN